MSYHSPWRWTDGQLEGFKAGLADPRAQYKVFALDTKRYSSTEAMAARGREARALVESWKPDLVYTTDDDAQELVTRHYLDTPIPQVFSGVNKAPAHYGFDKARNVTGVIEHEHFAESVQLLKKLVPGLKRLVVVLDEAAMWGPVVQRMKEAKLPPGVTIVGWETLRTFDEFKARMAAYPDIADGIALVGIFNFKDHAGKNVPYQEVLRWTAENSRLPDLGFWIDRVHYGTLAAVTVSEREQGLAAGRLARQILVEGKSPASLPIRATTKGLPVISLARAKKLGIAVRSEQLLAAQVIATFEWDKP
ncbi:MAG: hypothetical protein IPL06_15215 [Betaproteobacteria bacterium]|nr:hypothetical protein [Betaproteobacteria bacterium]